MGSTFLSPSLIWKDFGITAGITCEIIDESSSDGIVYSHLYIGGRKIGSSKVKIYSILARSEAVAKTEKNLEKVIPSEQLNFKKILDDPDSVLENAEKESDTPTIVLLNDFVDGMDLTFANHLVKKGFRVLLVDLAGNRDGETSEERYSVYPEQIKYANLPYSSYTDCEIVSSAKKTCWYEWAVSVRYAIQFLKERFYKSKIGIIGIHSVATVVWQVCATCTDVACACSIGNAGWYSYRGLSKFGNITEPQFSDDAVAFIAGVEPQSYAKMIKCPFLVLSPTNSSEYDCDRAYDTISRIDENIYTAIQYSVGSRDSVDNKCYVDLLLFLNEFLVCKKSTPLPKEVSVKGQIQDGILVVEVEPDTKNLKEVYLYVSEENVESQSRSWYIPQKSENGGGKKKDDKYIFEYTPYKDSKVVTFFAEAVYKNGFRVCSIIANKYFKPTEVEESNVNKILYASRVTNANTIFAVDEENRQRPHGIVLSQNGEIELKKGPCGLVGIYSKNGLLSFRINAKLFRPLPDSILMLDVFSKTKGELYIKLYADYFGEKVAYVNSIELTGADVWCNVKIERTKFKTVDGLPLKSFDKVEAIAFTSKQEFLINNALWV